MIQWVWNLTRKSMLVSSCQETRKEKRWRTKKKKSIWIRWRTINNTHLGHFLDILAVTACSANRWILFVFLIPSVFLWRRIEERISSGRKQSTYYSTNRNPCCGQALTAGSSLFFRRKHEQTPRIIAGPSTRQSIISSVCLIPSHSLNVLADRMCCGQHKQRRSRTQTKDSGWHLSATFQRVFSPCRGRLIDLSAKESAPSSGARPFVIWHLDYGETQSFTTELPIFFRSRV